MPLRSGASTRNSKPPLGGRDPEGRGDCSVILSLQNISTDTQQAQSRLGVLCPVLGSELGGQWHPAYGPSLASFGGESRMFALPLFVAPIALDTRGNAKQEGTP